MENTDRSPASLEQENRSKYGDRGNDVIAQAFTMSPVYGFVWCIFNAKKYIERFIRPGSAKGMKLVDLVKAKDYIDRAIQMHPDNVNTKDKDQG